MTDSTNGVAVISGGTRGVGLATARLFLERGLRVAILGRDAGRLDAARRDLDSTEERLLCLRADVGEEDAVEQAFAATVSRFGGVDVVVNNAGIALVRKLAETTTEDWERVLRTHATGTFLMSRAAVRLMEQGSGGAIVNVSSVSGRSGAALGTAYSAAKAAVLGLTRALAKEVAGAGIRVNVVCPGAIDTPMFHEDTLGEVARLFDKPADALLKRTLASIPIGRLTSADEVAQLISYLASDAGRSITGQTFVIDGGFDIH